MHKEYADNKYSAINLYNNMVIMFIKRVLGAAAGISCRTLKEILRYPSMIYIQQYFKGFPGLNSVNTKVYRKVFNTKYQTFRSTPLKPMISSNNPTATDSRIHHLFQSLFHKFKFAITEVFNFQCNWCFFPSKIRFVCHQLQRQTKWISIPSSQCLN